MSSLISLTEEAEFF